MAAEEALEVEVVVFEAVASAFENRTFVLQKAELYARPFSLLKFNQYLLDLCRV